MGFNYGGIRLNIGAILIFFLFFFSVDEINNKKTKKILDIITNYTPGIYFLHTILGKGYIMKYILGNKIKTLSGIIILYLFSYILCLLIDKFIGKTRFKYIIK